jgi:hypothetical protein
VSWAATIRPGAPFWSGFTAFCANEVALLALDKLDVLTVERAWLATLGGLFVAGAVYGRAKLDLPALALDLVAGSRPRTAGDDRARGGGAAARASRHGEGAPQR